MDYTQVKQTYEVFSKLQFVILKKYIKDITIYCTNNESMMNIHPKNGRKNKI